MCESIQLSCVSTIIFVKSGGSSCCLALDARSDYLILQDKNKEGDEKQNEDGDMESDPDIMNDEDELQPTVPFNQDACVRLRLLFYSICGTN